MMRTEKYLPLITEHVPTGWLVVTSHVITIGGIMICSILGKQFSFYFIVVLLAVAQIIRGGVYGVFWKGWEGCRFNTTCFSAHQEKWVPPGYS